MKNDRNRVLKGKRTIRLVNSTLISIDEAIAAVSTIGGTIYDMKLKELDDTAVWRVKLVRDGERVKVCVDAASGQIIEAKVAVTAMEPSLV
jgi:uncharacterized membrane protein YkoI